MINTTNLNEQSENFQRVEQAIEFLEVHFRDQPSLDEIAASVHLSKYHFQRLFKRWAGVTPAHFLHYLTIEYAKDRLRESQSIFDITLDAGLSSPSRLHDLFVSFEAMTPGEYKRQGAGLVIYYGIHPTPFGKCLLATTSRGICALRFLSLENQTRTLQEIQQEWPQATFTEDPARTATIIEHLFAGTRRGKPQPFHLLLKGTNFQVQVWQALLSIPPGALVTYQDVASRVGRPTATRAVANAIAKNPVGYLIPCHRVITKAGKTHRYRWGRTRKKAILGWEAGRVYERAGAPSLEGAL